MFSSVFQLPLYIPSVVSELKIRPKSGGNSTSPGFCPKIEFGVNSFGAYQKIRLPDTKPTQQTASETELKRVRKSLVGVFLQLTAEREKKTRKKKVDCLPLVSWRKGSLLNYSLPPCTIKLIESKPRGLFFFF